MIHWLGKYLGRQFKHLGKLIREKFELIRGEFDEGDRGIFWTIDCKNIENTNKAHKTLFKDHDNCKQPSIDCNKNKGGKASL